MNSYIRDFDSHDINTFEAYNVEELRDLFVKSTHSPQFRIFHTNIRSIQKTSWSWRLLLIELVNVIFI